MPGEDHHNLSTSFEVLHMNELRRDFDPRRGSRDNPDPTLRTRRDVVEKLTALRRSFDDIADTLRAAGATKEEVRKFAALEAQLVLFRRDFRTVS